MPGPEGEVRTGRGESKVARGADAPHAARVCGQLDGQSEERTQEDGNRNQERHRANDFLQAFLWEDKDTGDSQGGTKKPLVWLGLLVQSTGAGD